MTSNKLTLFLLIGALVTGGGGWYMANNYINTAVTDYKQSVDDGRELVSVVVAKADLAVGDMISNETAAIREIPRSYTNGDVITPATYDRIKGKIIAFPLTKGSAILPPYVEKTQKETFASLLPTGHRALSLPVGSLDTVSGFMRPGDFVDIMITMTGHDNRQNTLPLMENVKIMATDGSLNIEQGSRAPREVTIAVPPQEAARLVHAQEVGSIKFLLRPKGDQTTIAETVTVDNILGSMPNPEPVVAARGLQVLRGGR